MRNTHHPPLYPSGLHVVTDELEHIELHPVPHAIEAEPVPLEGCEVTELTLDAALREHPVFRTWHERRSGWLEVSYG